MKKEISAGGVIVRRRNSDWEVLLLKDKNDAWTFPKGLVENGESFEMTARREIQEEVGIDHLQLLKRLTPITYMYQWGQLIHKTVQYFLYRSEINQTLKAQKEEGIQEVAWITLEEALHSVGYPKTNRKLLEEAKLYLNTFAISS